MKKSVYPYSNLWRVIASLPLVPLILSGTAAVAQDRRHHRSHERTWHHNEQAVSTETVIGTDLGNGADTGSVSGGTATSSSNTDTRVIAVSTGNGPDTITNDGPASADSSVADTLTLSGFGFRAQGLNFTSEGIGFFGGNGNDTLTNNSSITVNSSGDGTINDLDFPLFGRRFFDVTSNINAIATGMDGGSGADVLNNFGTIDVTSTANVQRTGAGLDLFNAFFADTSATSHAEVYGIDGSTQPTTALNAGILNVSATATASSPEFSINIVNGTGDTSITAQADAIGIRGNHWNDTLTNQGTLGVHANASATRTTITLSASDGGIGNSTLSAIANATGIAGGGGVDSLTNSGQLSTNASASVSSNTIEFNLIDVAGGNIAMDPRATSIGIDGGWGSDTILNSATMDIRSSTESNSFGLNVTPVDVTVIGSGIQKLFGNSASSGSDDPNALSIGLQGGSGYDTITNNGFIGLQAKADASSVNIALAVAGAPSAFIPVFSGQKLANLDTSSAAEIVGISGGDQNDTIVNTGTIFGKFDGATGDPVGAVATASQTGVAISLPGSLIPSEFSYLPGSTLGGAGAKATATGTGISGGSGNDSLTNSGTIDFSASSEANAVSVSFEMPEFAPTEGGAPYDLSFTIADTETLAESFVTGMAGDGGSDTLINDTGGVIDVLGKSKATSTGVSVTMSFEGEGLNVIGELAMTRNATTSNATATGIDGGGGDDVIRNRGSVTANSDADAISTGVGVGLEGATEGVVVSGAIADTSATATATSTGIAGGDGADQLENTDTGSIDAVSNANAVSTSAALDLSGTAELGFAGNAAITRAGATSTATSTGVDWQSNDQSVDNKGAITADATAKSQTDSVSLAVSGVLEGGSASFAIADTTSDATANASGITAFDANDFLVNSHDLTATSDATANANSIGVDASLTMESGFGGGEALTLSGAHAHALSSGIDSDGGNDTIQNGSTITADSTTHANGNSISVAGQLATTGVAFGAALAQADTTADAQSYGIDAGSGADSVTNTGSITATSNANSHSVGVSVDIGAALEAGLAAGFGLTDTSTNGTSTSVAIDGGSGGDTITNDGTATADATSDSVSTSVSVALQGTIAGVALSAALTDAHTDATADGTAIDAGPGNDTVAGIGDASASATTNATSTSVSVDISGTFEAGLAGGASLARTGVTAQSDSTAVNGGTGDDTIALGGSTTSIASATGHSGSTSVAVQGSMAGAALGAALTDAHTDATANATGIDSGSGADQVSVLNQVTATSTSDAASNSVSVDVGIAGAGLSGGAALARTGATSTSNAFGVDTGDGADLVTNTARIDSNSTATASGTSVSVTLEGTLEGVALGASLTDADITADGHAVGIFGGDTSGIDPLALDDQLINAGEIWVTGTSTAHAASVSVTAPVAFVPGGASLARVRTTSTIDAAGMDGGSGNDTVVNQNLINSTATATAGGPTVSVNLVGASLGDTNADATATAAGMRGGTGDDGLGNTGTVNATSHATASGTAVTVNLVGASIGNVDTTATSTATGIGGDDGNDLVANAGIVNSTATADAPATSVSVNLAGAGLGDATTNAISAAYGVDGGNGDDSIDSTAKITASATSTTGGTGVSVGLIGDSDADVGTTAEATAAGIEGGAGMDVITDHAAIDSMASATAKSSSVNVNLIGAALGGAGTTATANASGVDGGDDDDQIQNDGVVTVTSTASVTAGTVNVTLAGASVGGTETNATANGTGIEGGRGNDIILNTETLNVSSGASTHASNVNVNILGAAIGAGSVSANANATGIGGGAGADQIGTQTGSTMTVSSHITSSSSSTSVTLAGAAATKGAFTLNSLSKGIDGGADDDVIAHDGSMDIDASATLTANSVNVSILGAALDNLASGSLVNALGIDAGSGDDTVISTGLVDVTSTASMTASATTFSLAGYAASKPQAGSDALATGIAGGDGIDLLQNDGTVNSDANATGTISGHNVVIAGVATSGTGLGTTATATGMDGGVDDDTVISTGAVTVGSHATMTLNSSSFSFAGVASSSGTVSADTTATGFAGGSGLDGIENDGTAAVGATSRLTASSGVTVVFGSASSGSATTSTTTATGMDGGDDADTMINTGVLGVVADSGITINRAAYSFIGGSSSSATLSASALGRAMAGGTGDDMISNTGTLGVTAIANATGTGNTTVTAGGAKVTSTGTSSATAVGLTGNAGDDTLTNSGSITIATYANPFSSNQANTGGFFTDTVSRSITYLGSSAVGMDGGAGLNTLINDGTVSLTLGGDSRASSASKGNTLSSIFGIDADANASSSASANNLSVTGFAVGDDANAIGNTGALTVLVATTGHSGANADADALASGDGTAVATTTIDSTRAYGIGAGSGDNMISNSGDITVTAAPVGDADTDSDADGIDFFRQPDSRSTSYVYVNDTRATGIQVGNGANTIVNDGNLTVLSAPKANQAEADAVTHSHTESVLGVDILTGLDAFATTYAAADNAAAYGILAGDGGNSIINTGTIDVRSTPYASANSRADAVGLDGDATATSSAYARNAHAIAVQTGSGDDFVQNAGTIRAIASPSVSAVSSSSPGFCPLEEILKAIGIDCGLTNSHPEHSSTSGAQAIAVTTGAGNDTLWLLDGSYTQGTIDLGADNDTLEISGTPTIVGSVNGGSGTDRLLFNGEGSFNYGYSSFERAMKQGAGIFSVASLPTMQYLSVTGGTLQIGSNYSYSSSGVFGTFVDGDGTFGQLSVTGTAALAGEIQVAAGDKLFFDGTTYDVITATSLTGSFSTETLPMATAFLSFSLDQQAADLNVVAAVAPFTSVASSTSRIELAVGNYLDRLAPVATGHLADFLAGLQRLPTDTDFGSLYRSLSPHRYARHARETYDTARRHMHAAEHRLYSLREHRNLTSNADSTAFDHPAMAYAESSRSHTPSGPTLGVWSASFTDLPVGGSGLSGRTDGVTTGFDFALGNSTIMGWSVGASSAALASSTDLTPSATHGTLFSLYGSQRLGKNGYLDTVVSLGNTRIQSEGTVTLGDMRFGLPASYSSHVMSAYTELGRNVKIGGMHPDLYVSMQFGSVRESGFDQNDNLGFDLQVDGHRAYYLESNLGTRASWDADTVIGHLASRLSIAWTRDIGVSSNSITARFAGAPDGMSFTVPMGLRARNGLRLSGALVLSGDKDNGSSLSFRADGDLRGTGSSGTSFLEFTQRF